MKKTTNPGESTDSKQVNKFMSGLGSEINEPVMMLVNEDFIIQEINVPIAREIFRQRNENFIHRSIFDILTEAGFSDQKIKDALNKYDQSRFSFIQLEKLISDKKEYFASIISVVIGKKNLYSINITINNSHIFYSYMNAIINNLPGSVYWKDVDGHYLGCNKFVATMAGYDSPDQIIGKTDYDLCWKEFADEWMLLDQKVMKENQMIIREELAKLADGRIITELTHKSPLKNEDNKIIGIIGTSLDITELKQTQAELKNSKELAEAANDAKTEFLENMRHDIRTPLTGIVGFADLLKMETGDPRVREYAENLVASSHALLDLLDEVLEAIQVSSGEIPKMKKKFSLVHTLNHVIQLNQAKAAQKKLSLSIQIDPNIPKFVIGDKVRIHRVALELVANALNFTQTGFVKLSISLAKRLQGKLVLKLLVEDSGIGIPVDKQQEIYLQFKRLTPSYQGIYKGAGLGLFVVKQFIDELGAEIYVESAPQKGSRFTCIIPVQESLLDDDFGTDNATEESIDYAQTSHAEQLNAPVPDSEEKKHRVLVVEDNLIAQSVAKAMLNELKCSVDIAESGKIAVDMWKQKNYDLIFMDIGLPDIDGYEVTHIIRIQELPKKTHVPIIALTAHAGDENKKRCIDAGMNAVLTKPLTAKSCADIVDAFIPGRQLADNHLPPPTADLPQNETELFNLSSYPLLDIEEGIKTTGNKPMLLDMLAFMINDSLPQDLELMKNAHNNNQWEKTQQIAHKIKGGAVYVGTQKMKIACQYFERYWKTGQTVLLEPLYEQAVVVIESTMAEIKGQLQ